MAGINNDMRRHASDTLIGPGGGILAPVRYSGFSVAIRFPLPLRDWRRQPDAVIRALYRFYRRHAAALFLCVVRARRAAAALIPVGQVWLFLPPRSGGYIDGSAIQAICSGLIFLTYRRLTNASSAAKRR